MTDAISRRALLLSLMASTALPHLARGQSATFQPIISDWPRRQPIFAGGGMVSSQEQIRILRGRSAIRLFLFRSPPNRGEISGQAAGLASGPSGA